MNNKQSEEKPKAKNQTVHTAQITSIQKSKLGAEMLEANHSTGTISQNDELQNRKIPTHKRFSLMRNNIKNWMIK